MKITCTCCGNVYYEESSCPKCGEPLKSNLIDKNFNLTTQNENISKVITDYDKRKFIYGCMAFIAIFVLGNVIVDLIDIISGMVTLQSFYTFVRFLLGNNAFVLVQMIILITSVILINTVNNESNQILRIIKINVITSIIIFVLNIVFNYRLFFIKYSILAGIATIADIISFYISNILLIGIIIFMIINVKKLKNKM